MLLLVFQFAPGASVLASVLLAELFIVSVVIPLASAAMTAYAGQRKS
jgi:hypothetical protein